MYNLISQCIIFTFKSIICTIIDLLIYFQIFCVIVVLFIQYIQSGPGGSMSYVVGLPNNSYKPITNTAWVRARLCKLQTRGSGEPVSLT